MNLQKQALILTLSLVGLTSMNYTGLKPALESDRNSALPPHLQELSWNYSVWSES